MGLNENENRNSAEPYLGFEIQICISNCLFNVSICKSDEYLKLKNLKCPKPDC